MVGLRRLLGSMLAEHPPRLVETPYLQNIKQHEQPRRRLRALLSTSWPQGTGDNTNCNGSSQENATCNEKARAMWVMLHGSVIGPVDHQSNVQRNVSQMQQCEHG